MAGKAGITINLIPPAPAGSAGNPGIAGNAGSAGNAGFTVNVVPPAASERDEGSSGASVSNALGVSEASFYSAYPSRGPYPSEKPGGLREPARSLCVPYKSYPNVGDVSASVRLTVDRAVLAAPQLTQGLTRLANKDSFEEAFCATIGLPREVSKAWAAWFKQGSGGGAITAEAINSKVGHLVQAELSVEIAEQILWEVLMLDGDGEVRCEKAARFLAVSWGNSHCYGEFDKELQDLAEQLLKKMGTSEEGLCREDLAKIRDVFPEFLDSVPTPLSAGGHAEDDARDSCSRTVAPFRTAGVRTEAGTGTAATFRRAPARRNTTSRAKQAKKWWSRVFQPWQTSRLDVAWTLLLSSFFLGYGYYGFHMADIAVDNFTIHLALTRWYSLARSCGAALNPMCAALLLPICGEVLAFLRHFGAHKFLPLDSAIAFHEWLGRWILVLSLVHTFGHVMNFRPMDDYTVWERLISVDGFNPAFTGIAGLTGTLLLVMLLIIFIFARRRSKNHNLFWCTHFLWLPWFVCLCLHAPNCWKWVCSPLVIWLCSRLMRWMDEYCGSSGRTSIVSMEVLPAGCTHLRITRPDKFNFVPGMWCRVKVPKLSSFEWHPFTISSAPEMKETFSLHIRAAGDWTGSLRDLARKLPRGQEVPVCVQGPFGAPTQHAWDSEHVVLVGAGIGVTPFSSILQSLTFKRARRSSKSSCSLEGAMEPGAEGPRAPGEAWQDGKTRSKVQHVDFIWVNRDLGAFTWFTRLLVRLAKEDRALRPEGEPFINFHLYLTSLKDNPRGLLKMMLSLAVDSMGSGDEANRYPIAEIAENVIPGRPDWRAVLNQIRCRQGHDKVKVLYCGPKPLGDTIHKQCNEFGFAFRKENF